MEVEDTFEVKTLRDLRTLTDSLGQVPSIETVVSPTTFSALRVDGDALTVEPIVGSATDPDSLALYRERMLDSEAVGYVINPEATAVALFLKIDTDINQYEGRETVLEDIRRVLAPYEGDYVVRYSGFPYIRNMYANLLKQETGKYVFLSSLVVLLALLWLFRGVRGVVLPLTTVYLGVLTTVAVQMLFRQPIDVLSSTIAAIILCGGSCGCDSTCL